MKKTGFGFKQVIAALLYFLGLPALLILVGGDARWWQAWAYIAISIFFTIVSRVLIAKFHPDLIAERAQYQDHRDTKSWDRLLAPISAFLLPLVYLIVAGLDWRFGWSPSLPMGITIAAMLLIIGAYAFTTWAMVVNRFFSANVRIQHDRGHFVIEDGPYRFVRHPGYAGGLLVVLLLPLMLNTLWAYLPILFFVVVVLVRTAKEDKALVDELPGYAAYTTRTKYRIFPGVW